MRAVEPLCQVSMPFRDPTRVLPESPSDHGCANTEHVPS